MMNLQIQNCQMCPLNLKMPNGCYPCPGRGKEKFARLMFVAEKSDTVSCALGESFSDVSGDFLQRILNDAGIDPDECYFTYLVKCNDFNPKAVRACSTWIDQEIKAIQPDHIISLGMKTAAFFLPKIKTFKDSLYQIYNNVLIAPSLHTILNGSNKDLKVFSKKIKELYDLS